MTASSHSANSIVSCRAARSPTGGCPSRAWWFAGILHAPELKRMPARTQITRHTCEEDGPPSAGGPAYTQPGSRRRRRPPADARFVVFHSFDDWIDSIDLLDALHPQTILAYGMNGQDMPILTAHRSGCESNGKWVTRA